MLFKLFLLSLLFCFLSLAGYGEGALEVREVSGGESLRSLLEENRELKKDIQNMRGSNERLNSRLNLYAQRIRVLNDQIRSLERQLEAAEENKKEQSRELSRLEVKVESLKSQEALARSDYFSEPAEEERHLAKDKDSGSFAEGPSLIREEIKDLKRQNGILYYNLGNKLFRENRYQMAVEKYNKALELLSGDPDTVYNLAVVYDYYLKEPQKAVKYYFMYLDSKTGRRDSLVKERIVENQLKAKFMEER